MTAKKEMIGRGITVGRISCPTVWTSICMNCFEKIPMSQKKKKEYLQSDMAMKELVDNLIITSDQKPKD